MGEPADGLAGVKRKHPDSNPNPWGTLLLGGVVEDVITVYGFVYTVEEGFTGPPSWELVPHTGLQNLTVYNLCNIYGKTTPYIYKLPSNDVLRRLKSNYGTIDQHLWKNHKWDKDLTELELVYVKMLQTHTKSTKYDWDLSGQWACGLIERGVGLISNENEISMGFKHQEFFK
jgi:hypothetical protein